MKQDASQRLRKPIPAEYNEFKIYCWLLRTILWAVLLSAVSSPQLWDAAFLNLDLHKPSRSTITYKWNFTKLSPAIWAEREKHPFANGTNKLLGFSRKLMVRDIQGEPVWLPFRVVLSFCADGKCPWKWDNEDIYITVMLKNLNCKCWQDWSSFALGSHFYFTPK